QTRIPARVRISARLWRRKQTSETIKALVDATSEDCGAMVRLRCAKKDSFGRAVRRQNDEGVSCAFILATILPQVVSTYVLPHWTGWTRQGADMAGPRGSYPGARWMRRTTVPVCVRRVKPGARVA